MNIAYNKEEKLKELRENKEDIDPEIYTFLIKLNKIDGIRTRSSCSGHFILDGWTKSQDALFILRPFDVCYMGHSMFDRRSKIEYFDPQVIMEHTPEAEKIVPFFEKNGFKVCKYDNRLLENSYIIFEKHLARVNWNRLMKKLDKQGFKQ